MPTELLDHERRLSNTFGVELEMNARGRAAEDLSAYLRQYMRQAEGKCFHPVSTCRGSDGTMWDAKYDASCGLELTSPALTWATVWELREVTAALQAWNFTANERCGLHVHHHCPNLTDRELRRIWLQWAAYEAVIFECLPTHRRNNYYCQALLREPWTALKRRVTPVALFPGMVRDMERYRTLNMLHWWRTARIEIRVHHGTLVAEDILQWVLFTQEFIHAAKESVRYSTVERIARMPLAQQYAELLSLLSGRCGSADAEAINGYLKQKIAEFHPSSVLLAA